MSKERIEQKETKETNNNEEIKLVIFRISEEEFGADISKVKEIRKMEEITKVPKAPFFVEGVMNLRGQVIPIIDLRKRFNLAKKEATKETRIVVIELDKKMIGMIVDTVSEVKTITQDAIEPPPPIVAGINAEYIIGVAKLEEEKLIILLDLNEILSTEEQDEISLI